MTNKAESLSSAWVDYNNSTLPKAAIHYWRNPFGMSGDFVIGSGGWFGLAFAVTMQPGFQ